MFTPYTPPHTQNAENMQIDEEFSRKFIIVVRLQYIWKYIMNLDLGTNK